MVYKSFGVDGLGTEPGLGVAPIPFGPTRSPGPEWICDRPGTPSPLPLSGPGPVIEFSVKSN